MLFQPLPGEIRLAPALAPFCQQFRTFSSASAIAHSRGATIHGIGRSGTEGRRQHSLIVGECRRLTEGGDDHDGGWFDVLIILKGNRKRALALRRSCFDQDVRCVEVGVAVGPTSTAIYARYRYGAEKRAPLMMSGAKRREQGHRQQFSLLQASRAYVSAVSTRSSNSFSRRSILCSRSRA
jgi:hypothetical protein